MTRADRILCVVYAALAAVALVGTQWTLVVFLRSADNDLGGLWDGITANPVSGFLGIDLGVVAVAAVVLMSVEGRRLRIPWWGIYVALVFLVAVSVAFPLFLVARTRVLANERVLSAG
ncbi:hypothetical protein ACVW00_001449 [Marmoricola sp. URHA0025 HA25]